MIKVMKLKAQVLKTLVSVDFLIHKTASSYDLSRRVCLKLCALHSSQCALSGTEAFYSEEYPVPGTLRMYSKKP